MFITADKTILYGSYLLETLVSVNADSSLHKRRVMCLLRWTELTKYYE